MSDPGCKGAFVEYVSVSEDALALKPTNLTFLQAAVVPMSGFTAPQGLRDKERIQSGIIGFGRRQNRKDVEKLKAVPES